MTTREEYIRKMQVKLEEWNSEISTLNSKACEVKADVTNEYYGQIELLKAKQASARQTIEELQQAGESAWGDLKSGIGLSWDAMGEAFNSAKSRFK